MVYFRHSWMFVSVAGHSQCLFQQCILFITFLQFFARTTPETYVSARIKGVLFEERREE